MTSFKAVIFDLGGTLIEYAGDYSSWPELETPGMLAAYAYLDRRGVALPGTESFIRAGQAILPGRWLMATAGERNLTLPSLLQEMLSALKVDKPDAEVIATAADRYESAVCHKATVMPHAPEIVARLKNEGYRLGLISNTMFSGRIHMSDLQRFGLLRYFESLLFSADANKWKPNVAAFEHVLKELGVKAEESAFVGDDPAADIVGGLAAGLYTIHYRSSRRFRSPDGLEPDATIETMLELPQTLARPGTLE
jgi:HAD superfamily hydrolase (TIGR01509 family)